MTEEYYMKVQELHDELALTEELIMMMKELEDDAEFRNRLEFLKDYASKGWAALLCQMASHYLNIIRNIGHETSARAQLEMVRDKLQNEFNQMEPREENDKLQNEFEQLEPREEN